jgi:Ca-activated chloride channel family protein
MKANSIRKRRPLAVLAAAFSLGAGVFPEARAAGLLVADGGFGGALEIEEHEVAVTIEDGIAITEVTQVFRNLENRQVEALYTFPVPRGASVSNFSMWIQGKEMVGEVVEKQRAREIYDSYKARRVDPGILEQVDYRSFEMRVFPIAPRAAQKVQVTYYQELDHDHDWVTYVYPLATATRRDVTARTRGKFALSAHLRSAIPVAAVESPSHADDFAVARHADTYVEARLEPRDGDLNRDVVLAYKLSRPLTGCDLVTSRPEGEDGYFCLLLTAGDDLGTRSAGMDYVFVLDISGSMERDGKLEASRGSIAAFLKEIGPDDRFELIAFNIQPHVLFEKLLPASPENLARAGTFLSTREARGGTVLAPAIGTAFKYAAPDRTLNIVILSDGLTEQKDLATLAGLIRDRPPGSRIFAIGVGNDVNRKALEQTAEFAGGLAAFISRGDDFTRQAQAFRRKLTRAVLTGATVEIDGVKTRDLERLNPLHLYHGVPARVYGRFAGGGPATVRLRGQAGGAPFERKFEVEFPRAGKSRPEIERMWAWHRVNRLEKEGGGPDAIAEIVRLGEGFSIVTEHTSFLVLENDTEYRRWKIERRNLDRTRRDREARQELLARLERLRSESLSGIGPVDASQPTSGAAPPASSEPVARAQPPASPGSAPEPARSSPFGGGSGPVGPLFVALSAWLLRKKRRDDAS